MNLNDLIEKRLRLVGRMRELVDRADDENRDLTAEEQEQFDRLNAEVDRLGAEIERRRQLADLEKRLADTRAEQGIDPARTDRPNDGEILRAIATGERGGHEFRAEQRDLTTSNASGAVPEGFYGRLWGAAIDTSVVLERATILRTESGEPLKLPRVTANPQATLVGEANPITESDPTVSSVALGAYKYAWLTQLSTELIDDSGVDLEEYLAGIAGPALGRGIGAHLIAGSGSDQPNGLITAATVGKTGAAGEASPTFDSLIDLKHSVPAPYRRTESSGWLANDTSIAAVRKLKDSNGQFLWSPSTRAGDPDMILGHPVWVDPDMPDPAAGARSWAFGSIRAYHVRLAGGIRVERSAEFAFDQDLVTLKFVLRGDGDLVDANAVKVFVGG